MGESGEKTKQILKNLGKKLIKPTIIISIIILIFVSLFWAAIKGVFDSTSNIFKDVLNNITIKGNDLNIDDDYMKEAKSRLKKQGIDAKTLGLEGHEEYLERFLEAEIVTSYPYLGGKGLQGTVYFERASSDGTTKQLKYKEYNDFYSSKESDDIYDYFTIDTKDWTVHVKKRDGDIEKINYKNMVSRFSMPFEFPIALAQVTQNPQFALAVVKLVKKSKIVITIAESKTTIENKNWQEYNLTSELHKDDGTVTKLNDNVKVSTNPTYDTREYYSTNVYLSRASTWIVNVTGNLEYHGDDPAVVTNNETDLEDTSSAEHFEGEDGSTGGTLYTYQTNRKQKTETTTTYKRWVKGSNKVIEKTDRFINLILRKGSILGGEGLVEIAKNCHDYLSENNYWYPSAANMAAGGYVSDGSPTTHKFPEEGEAESKRYVDCSAYVSWVLQKAGYDMGLKSAAAIGEWGKQQGWDEIDNVSDLQAGDICIWNGGGHTNICVGENDQGQKIFYDCGDTNSIRAKDPITCDWNKLDYAVRPNDEIAESLSVPKDAQKLKDKLSKMIDTFGEGKYSISYMDLNKSANLGNINNGRIASDGWTKLFIMASTFRAVNEGKLKMEDVETTVERMITTDNNSDANILLKTLGNGEIAKGIDKVNEDLRENGYSSTKVTNEMGSSFDREGDKENYTSVSDVTKLLKQILQKRCISNAMSEKMIEILQNQTITDIIPSQIESSSVGNKTGEQNNIVQDAAIVSIEKANYVVAISASKISSTETAKDNMRKLAKLINEYFETNGTLKNNKETDEDDDEIPTKLNGRRVCYKVSNGGWECPLNNLVEGSKMLFKLLGSNQKTQEHERLMRYLMYLLTGHDYGVTEFDFNEFIFGSFNEAGGIYGNTTEEKVWWALIGAGYSKEAAAGVLGNIYAESGFNAAVIEHGNGIGLGLCQWSYGRRTQLEGYAASKGVQASDINTQIEFLLGELTPGGGAGGFANYQMGGGMNGYTVENWKNASSPEDAAIAFCWVFERPGIPRMDIRTAAARRYYEQFKDAQKPSGSDGVGTDIQKKIVDLAVNHGYEYNPTPARCLAWVDDIYDAAGVRADRKPCASEACDAHKVSTDRNNIPIGAAVYGWSSPVVYCGGHNAGHVGIYIGNGQIISNAGGKIVTNTIDQWISIYSYDNSFRGWGWENGSDLSK